MSENQLIKKQQKELETIDKQTLPDTLNASEWQTFLLSGFLNEYSIVQADANIEKMKTKIKELEELDFSNKDKKPSFFNDTFATFSVNFMQALSMSAPFYIGYVVVSLIVSIFSESIYNILNNIYIFAVKLVMWPATLFFNYDIENLNPIITVIIAYIGFAIIIGLLFSISTMLGFRKRLEIFNENDSLLKNKEKEKQKALEEARKELNDYQLVAKDIKDECNANLQEIYNENRIPEIYHDYESLGMLYGYFACGAALSFQDAAKEYLKDKRTQAIVNVMEQTNDLLSLIAQGADVFAMNQEETNEKLNTIIEQNNRSILGKLFPNNPISAIYSKANNIVKKLFKK